VVKILSQSGRSLADIYDAEGSIAGIDQLETRELPIVHEMGATVFSERFVTSIRRMASGALAQNTAISLALATLPSTPTRLLGVAVISDVAARVDRLAISLRDPGATNEIPVWVFDGNSTPIEFADAGAGTATFDLLGAQQVFTPSFVGGNGQPGRMVSDIAVRGDTTGFGAGDVFVRVFLHIAFAAAGGVSSFGLPLPGW